MKSLMLSDTHEKFEKINSMFLRFDDIFVIQNRMLDTSIDNTDLYLSRRYHREVLGI